MQDPVVDTLDRLDAHWAARQHSPDLTAWIGAIDHALRATIVEELLLADLEYRFKQRGEATGPAARLPWLADQYVQLIPDDLESLQTKLLCEESLFRLRACEDLTIEALAGELAEQRSGAHQTKAEWQCRVAKTLDERRPVTIVWRHRATLRKGPSFRFSLAGTLAVGRAEHAQIEIPSLRAHPSPKLCIAKHTDVSISRDQMHVARVAVQSIIVTNRSKKIPIERGQGGVALAPQATTTITLPCTLWIDSVGLAFEKA